MALTKSYLNQYPRGPGGIQRNPIYPKGPGGIQQYPKGPGGIQRNPWQPPPQIGLPPPYHPPPTYFGTVGAGTQPPTNYPYQPFYPPPGGTDVRYPYQLPNQYGRPNMGGQWQGRLPQQFQQPNYSNMPYFLQQLLGLVR